jgi:hypothetical protein
MVTKFNRRLFKKPKPATSCAHSMRIKNKFVSGLFIFIFGKIITSHLILSDKSNHGGFANQVIFFQNVLHNIFTNYKNYTFVINGPKSRHIQGSYGNNFFTDFFKLRSISGCKKLVHEEPRKNNCENYIHLILNAKYKKNFSFESNQKIKYLNGLNGSKAYCLPFEYQSRESGILHCKMGKIKELPFFFELFEFEKFIIELGNQFLKEFIQNKKFAVFHFRSGDFKRRGLKKAYFSFRYSIDYVRKLVQKANIDKIFIMTEKLGPNERLPRDGLVLEEQWISKHLLKMNLKRYLDSNSFIKILIEMYISSKCKLYVGSHYSTLSEITIYYAKMKNSQLPAFFVE